MKTLRQLPIGNGDFYEVLFEDTTVYRITYYASNSQTGAENEFKDLDVDTKRKIAKLVFTYDAHHASNNTDKSKR